MRLEAPAKLNLSLHVSPPRSDGYHPLESLTQTIDWLDSLELREADDDEEVVVIGETEIEDNIVERALAVLREEVSVPRLEMTLTKSIPMSAGMGGGSSDAAAAILGAASIAGVPPVDLFDVARRIGADVPLFLEGGTQLMTGIGDRLERRRPLGGFAVGVVIPDFGLSTTDVYAEWDRLEGPTGEQLQDDRLPPELRDGMPIRNDLVPAAIAIEPRLGDFMADLRAAWGAVSMTGSGSACFGYFPSLDEALAAVGDVTDLVTGGRGVDLRDHGVSTVTQADY